MLALGCTGPQTDAPPPVSETSDTSTTPPAEPCGKLDRPARPFDSSPGGLEFGDVAGDFTIEDVDGTPWTLSEAWTGCDSYLFVAYHPGAAGDALWSSDPGDLLDAAPANTHVFFVSDESTRSDRRARLEELEVRLDLGARKRERVHLVLNRLSRIDGSVGELVSDYQDWQPESGVDLGDRGTAMAPDLVMFGIDADQRWDPGGSISQYVGGPSLFEMAGYLGHFYNHKSDLSHRLSVEAATVVPLLDASVTDRVFVVEADLPEGEDLEAFDTLEVDVQVTCPHRNPFACSEWDRIARVELCIDGSACTDRREIARWITPYWRRGTRRWAIDASPMLPLLTGGATTFRVEMGPDWEAKTEREAHISLRLSTRDVERPRGAQRVYTGGPFDVDYDAAHPPVAFTPPADATRVELVALLSGHGQVAGTNCAEWCDHQHVFAVDGEALPTVSHGQTIGVLPGCAESAALGVPPGQWGNWAPSRAYWCPGLPVAPIRVDLTEQVRAGADNQLSYTATLQGQLPPGGGDIDLTAYVVWY